MVQAKFTLDDSQIVFLERHKEFGFKDKSSLVRQAVDGLRRQLDQEMLEESAELYAELFESDQEIQEMTESAINDWPA